MLHHRGFYKGYNFEVELFLHDSKIGDGNWCTAYDEMDVTHEQCNENILKQHVKKWYGCMLPWFNNIANDSCEDKTNVLVVDEVYDEVKKFINGWKMQLFDPCLDPCLKMTFKVKELIHTHNRISDSFVRFDINEKVTVFTEVYAYDVFSLFVDLGSALGLWLGLSAVGLFTLTFDYAAYARKKYYH